MKYRYREPHEMKDSGVEWLGMIPKEWKNNKFSRIFKEFSGQGFPIELQGKMKGVPFFKVSDINLNEKYVETANNYVSTEIISIKKWNIIPRNTIVLAKIGEALRKNHRKILKVDGLIDNNLVGLFCKEWDTNYSYYYFKCINMEWYLNPGAVPSINMNFLRESILANPDILEQQKIADFLDKKCEEFDSVIAKKEMLINKLEEAKKSLISEVVTGKVKVIQKENGEYGIIKREAHEMKDSGVEWLGVIPKEWQVSKMKNKLIKFTDGAHISPEVENGVYPFLSVKDLKNGFLDFKNCLKTSIESYKYLKRNSCKPERGDLLISKDGTIGKTCLIDFDKEFVVASSLVIIKSNKNFSIKFLDYILQSEASQKQIFQYVKGAALPRISLELLKNIYIPFINQQDEQIKINNLLDKKCSQFDIAIEKQKEIIEKLKLAKQSLISEAVTGKIEIL
ncbi:restriction endonuclease subunit S [Cetobacterium sp.]|uniref:restriction endonuclease subunit S n=1 Tax=Cetobacterium sp. TaxID=2071632 RepID=UPI003F3904BA